MKLILTGLMFAAMSAQATPVMGNEHLLTFPIAFHTPVHQITVDDVPDWAKDKNAVAWYEIQIGIIQNDGEGLMLVMRGLMRAYNSDLPSVSWLELLPLQGLNIDDIVNPTNMSPNPEPGTWLLLGTGFAALLYARKRSRRASAMTYPIGHVD